MDSNSDHGVNSCNIFEDCSECDNDISCFKKIAGVLSDVEIKKHKLILGSKEENYNPTVYDLSLGSFHYVYGPKQIDKLPKGKNRRKKKNSAADLEQAWIPVCIGSEQEFIDQNKGREPDDKFIRQDKTKTNILTIPALGSALIQLDEVIDTYTIALEKSILVTARFDLKLTLVNQGLISQQGTQIEPCYKGRLYCFVHNFSNEPIELKQGGAIASVEFSYVSCFCNEDKRKEVISSLVEKNKSRYLADDYCDPGKGIIHIRYFNRKKYLPRDCGLANLSDNAIAAVQDAKVIDAIAATVNKKIDKRTMIITTSITAIAAIAVAVISGYFGVIKPLIDTNHELSTNVYEYQQNIDTYKNQLDDLEERIEIIEAQAETP